MNNQPESAEGAGNQTGGRAEPRPDSWPRASTDLSTITDPRILQALRWWQALAAAALPRPGGGPPVPDRSQLNPADITALLPYAMMWDVRHEGDGGLQYRCRLAGTLLVEIYGREIAGMSVEEFLGDGAPLIRPDFDFVVRSGQPHYVERRMTWAHKSYRKYRRILMPFTRRDAAEAGDAPGLVRILFNVTSFVPD